MKEMADVILDHRITRTGRCSCGDVLLDTSPERIAAHGAEALAAAGFGPVKEAAAGALEEAAELVKPFSGIGMANGAGRAEISAWLSSRAATLRDRA